jgi:hypothetical protein
MSDIKHLPVVAVVAMLVTTPNLAAPLTLKCTAHNGETTEPLILDVDQGTMKWGISTYKIRTITDRYISAYQIMGDQEVGGEIWVLNRTTGEYLRASVYTGTDKAWLPRATTLASGIYKGKSSRPLL